MVEGLCGRTLDNWRTAKEIVTKPLADQERDLGNASRMTVLLKANPAEVRDFLAGTWRQTARVSSLSSTAWLAFRFELERFAHWQGL
jgi:hypothetical protein